MTRNTLHVRALDGRDMIEVEGEGIEWGNDPAQKAWTGFDRIRLLLGDGSRLVLDANPAPPIAPPHGASARPCLEIGSEGALEALPGKPRVRRLRHRHHLRAVFHWPNPLTPAGIGLWLQLEFQSWKRDRPLFLLGRKEGGEGSKIWYSPSPDPSPSRWERSNRDPICDSAGPGCDDGRISFDDFAAKAIRYCDWIGDDRDHLGPLVDGAAGSDAWIVDLAGRSRRIYTLSVSDAADGRDRQLVAGLDLDARSTDNAPVSSRAMGGVPAMLDHSTLAARDVSLRCARAAAAGRDRWIVDWRIPCDGAHNPRDIVSLPTAWRHLASHYPLGLAAARARSRFTLVPTRLACADGPEPATLRFEAICDTDGNARITQLRQISIGVGRAMTATLGGAQAVDGRPTGLSFVAHDHFMHDGPGTGRFRRIGEAAAKEKPFPDECVAIEIAGRSQGASPIDWLIGGVHVRADDLKLAGDKPSMLRFRLEERGETVERRPLGCDIALHFERAALAPASQDPEPGFESLSAWLDRPRPISIDMAAGSAQGLDLSVSERANAGQSRVLRIAARADPAGETRDFDSDVVVIDPSPLTIARVRDRRTLPGGSLVAEYSDDSENAAGWEFAVAAGDMEIVLPPQAIGEEMIKGRLSLPDGREVPLAALPFGYRLGANASLKVDRTDIDTARAAPPWMLRRHLARRTGVTGLKLDGAAFELVYGLTTRVTAKGLRIAELDALIGRIPFADSLVQRVGEARSEGPTATAQRAYAETQARWIGDLLNRPSWWPLFRDIADRRQLVLRDDVDVSLRTGRESAHPFAIGTSANGRPAGPVLPLRGGVDWLFQSPGIYEEFTDGPDSTEAMIEGVAFGPLGGEGSQSAHFANGKTIIVSRTRQGHLESLVLMRIGRIAMLWNRARHVIVYQRSTRRAPRYEGVGGWDGTDSYDRQRPFDGHMALRKVREYIEITEPRRRYPDFATELPLTGPCLRSSFETVVMPVKAGWARDIDRGQLIALGGPVAEAERRFFPRPRIFLEMARAEEKGGGLIASEIADPGQLLFFTSTRPQDGGDTDRWPAWPEVDYPLIEPAAPPALGFRPHFTGARRQPDAPRADLGQSRFTIDLIPNEEAANLMHGRQEKAIEARISSVSLSRGRPPIATPPQSLSAIIGDPLASANAIVSEKLAELGAYAKAHAAGVTDPASPEHQLFVTEARALLASLDGAIGGPLLAQLGERADPADPGKGRLRHATGEWTRRQAEAARHYADNVASDMAAARGQIDALTALTATEDFDEAKRRAVALMETLAREATDRIARVGSIPDQAVGRLEAAIDRIERMVLLALDTARVALRTAARTARAAFEANAGRADPLYRDWKRSALDSLAAIDRLRIGAPTMVSGQLGPLFAAAGPDSVHERFVAVIRAELDRLAAALDARIAAIASFDPPPDWNGLETIAAEAVGPAKGWLDAIVADGLEPLREAAKSAGLDGAVAEAQGRIDALRRDVVDATDQAALVEAIGLARARFDEWSGAGRAALTGAIRERLLEIGTNVGLKALAGEFDAALAFAEAMAKPDSWPAKLDAALDEPDIAAMARAIETEGRALAEGFASAVKHAEHAIVADLKAEIEAAGRDLLAEAAAPTLELGRALATGIVTDTLGCTRDQLGYYYKRGEQLLQVTRASAILNDLGKGNLNALSAFVPFDRLRDRLLPQLENIDYSSLFPDFAGLKLEHLFPELRVAKDKLGEYDWLTIRHGFDKDRLTAWSDVTIDKRFEDAPTLFALPPLTLTLGDARLTAHSRLEIGAEGGRVQDVAGSILADWTLSLGGKPVVTMRRAALVFGNDGRFKFDFDSENIVLAPELKFITDAIRQLLPQDEGLTIAPALPAGISAALALPLPDLGTGAFTITGVTLHAHFGLLIGDRFTVRTGFWLSKPDRPFGLAILFLGGGGWVGVEASYSPPGRFVTRVSIGVSAGAFVALNLGFARASAGLMFTAGVDFYRDSASGKGSTAISLGLLIWGDFSILSIAHAYLRITARITYTDSGGMTAIGRVEVKIRISYFYTLRVNRDFRKQFSGKGRSAAASEMAALAGPTIAEAVECHFLTLDLPR